MTSDSKLIDGKAFAAGLSAQLKTRVAEVAAAHGFTPGLAVVIVGEDPASQIYVKNKGEQTLAAGMRSYTHRLPADTTQAALLALIAKMNADNDIDGILVQLPLPGHIDAQSVIGAIDPDKDVDGFHVVNAGRLATGGQGLVPCTPLGCILLLKDRLGDLSGLEAVVVGRSNIVGRPLAQLLIDQNCTVTLAHSRTKNLAEVCRRGDILIGAVGRPLMLGPEHIKPGAVVIDVGINRIPSSDPEKAAAGKTRVVGDVDFQAVLGQVQAITPVPGGVGPMTIAVLLRNTLQAALQRRGLKLAL